MKTKIIIALVCLTGCNSNIKSKIGLSHTIPNENQVKILHPLEAPKHFDLPEPQHEEPLDQRNNHETSVRAIPAPR